MATQRSATAESSSSVDVRSRIIAATAKLVAAGGSDAATTRAVAAAASVQAPTIYRLFGDKDGLLDVVAEQTFAAFIDAKVQREPADEPLEDLREGWDSYIAFGLANPAVFSLMSARPARPSRASEAGLAVLRKRVRRVALTGQLRVTEERAVDLIHAVGTGTVLALLEKAPEEREGLAEAARDAVFATVIGDQPRSYVAGAKGAASALRACLDDVGVLSPGERQLLGELLQRIALEP
jgi:AcrR family transcriptional regulator